MNIENKEDVEGFLKHQYDHVFFIRCIPFRQKHLKGDLAYSFLENKNRTNDVRVIRVSNISMKLIETLKEIQSLVGKFNCCVLNDSGELSQFNAMSLMPKLIYRLPSQRDKVSVSVSKSTNVNFFSNVRSYLLKSFILNYKQGIKDFSILQFSKKCEVPQSTAQNFKKVGIETGHLKINKVGGLSLVDLGSTLEEWCFKQEQASSYYAQHLFNDDPESVIEEIANKAQDGKVALGAYLTLKNDRLYPVSYGTPSLYLEGDMKSFIESNELVLINEKTKNSIEIRVPKSSMRLFDVKLEPYKQILKLDHVQCYLDLRHGVRGEEIKDFLLNRIFKEMNQRMSGNMYE